ncbi:UDP-2,4-diacetamido-2,4,6-trideoxy-beta-L-altropyranose hydrolase [Rhodoferax sp. 4810]|uniref:UDP-2,4-diacetamido-2,4, 6-trideoxy-beta-L-altropyranose hydrolase n=1 Tax=Thiospirillum jenense TaxID=1653858 RepID=A0A839HF31_9GAMM|nr:UDP-2,4-diacetamido-2,4,6-trideoxy-beta-L-altropyranose hydrolase [Thiospirillum jenense]MBB1073508.1 UDP-2,4-diacetamido-2,4,6-trideoxy-beta-L-altropyranose hydrolase [Rhodoferax jenense]MBB1125996.1 UDP-2,4-diacetamido-2,4,6-trideoxy-beta-L-altropyranose hydrolase [Thiospirillum jenense]
MKVVFRVDASISLGTGHVMRCLVLAEELKKRGVITQFVCRELLNNLYEKILVQGHEVTFLPTGLNNFLHDAEQSRLAFQQADWLVVDHYELDRFWEKQLRPYVQHILVIDDLANRPHDCDILLDQNLRDNEAYKDLVPTRCIRLIGPRYALLRSQFVEQRQKLIKQFDTVRRILVFFGGTDAKGVTLKALEALAQIKPIENLIVDVVIGEANPHRDAIQSACNASPHQTHLYCEVDNMAELMAQADLALGAGGSATWERCCLGLPSLVVTVEDNQDVNGIPCLKKGVLIYLGCLHEVEVKQWVSELDDMLNNSTKRADISKAAMQLTNGYGCQYLFQAMNKVL